MWALAQHTRAEFTLTQQEWDAIRIKERTNAILSILSTDVSVYVCMYLRVCMLVCFHLSISLYCLSVCVFVCVYVGLCARMLWHFSLLRGAGDPEGSRPKHDAAHGSPSPSSPPRIRVG